MLRQLLAQHVAEQFDRHLAPVVQHAVVGWRIHCQTCAREISAVAASSIRLLIGTQPMPAQPRLEVLDADADVGAQARLGDRALGGTASRSAAVDLHVLALARRSGWAAASRGRRSPWRSAPGPDAPPRCRRGRRWPRAPCRRAPCASARSLASGSLLIGICAAMPPIACAPRRWQVLMQQQRVGAHEGRGHRHLRAVGQDERRDRCAELLDGAEDVVPAPAVQARRSGRAARRGSRPSRRRRASSRSAPSP